MSMLTKTWRTTLSLHYAHSRATALQAGRSASPNVNRVLIGRSSGAECNEEADWPFHFLAGCLLFSTGKLRQQSFGQREKQLGLIHEISVQKDKTAQTSMQTATAAFQWLFYVKLM